MSESLSFDPLAHAEKLIASGISPVDARAHAEALRESIGKNVVTKQDLARLEERLILKLTIRMGIMWIGAISIQATLTNIL